MIKQRDCLELMKELEDNSVDLIENDQPYCVEATSNRAKAPFTDFNLMRPFWEKCFQSSIPISLLYNKIIIT